MAVTSFSSLLGFALPTTGDLSGTWGDTVNTGITALVDSAVAGTATASVASGNWTLTSTQGATNEARAAILKPTGSPGVSRNIIAPSQSKAYIVVNQSNAVVVVKGTATTGVSIVAGATALVAWDGSDFVDVTAIASGLRSATTTVNVSSSAAPTVGQVLTATSGTAATWQTPSTLTAANSLNSATTTVNVSSSAAPTVGQVLTATSGTAATWQTSTDLPLSGGVMTGAITFNAGQTVANLAAGSAGTIPYQSASGTTQMLAVGTAGQLLQTNGAGAPTWVAPSTGAMALLSTVNIAGTRVHNFTGLSGKSYYQLVVTATCSSTFAANTVFIQIGTGSAAANSYYWGGVNANGTSLTGSENDGVSTGLQPFGDLQNLSNAYSVQITANIFHSTGMNPTFQCSANGYGSGNNTQAAQISGVWLGGTSMSSIHLDLGNTSFTGKIYLYGVSNA